MSLKSLFAYTAVCAMREKCGDCFVKRRHEKVFLDPYESILDKTVIFPGEDEQYCAVNESAMYCQYTGTILPWASKLKNLGYFIEVEEQC